MKKIFGALCLVSFFAMGSMNAQINTTENVAPTAADVVKKDESKKACSADCKKACCAKDAKACSKDAKACSKECAKACCADKGLKCSKADKKACKKDAKACAAKCAKSEAAASKAAMTDEMVERKVCAHSGKVSYSRKNVCEKSGKVSYSDVIYDTEKAKFVDLEVAPVNEDEVDSPLSYILD